MGEGHGGLGRRTFGAAALAVLGIVVLQSAVHLAVVLGAGDHHSVFDLDRSNGVPDLVSTVALSAAVAGAVALAWATSGGHRIVAAVLAAVLAGLTLADLMHEGAHPSSRDGSIVVGLVMAAAALLAVVAVTATTRPRVTLALAACLLTASFLTSGLDRFDQWFERRRGDPVAEYRIVAKEGLELLGWSLVGLALWDEALRRRAPRASGQRRG